jgi:hypothetical protein
MHIQPIEQRFVNQYWPHVESMLERGLAYCQGDYTIGQLRFTCVRGEQVLLTAVDDEKIVGAATMVFEDWPNCRSAFITCIGGKMISTPDMWNQLRQLCINHGATKIRGAARESVARLWKQKFDFKQKYVIVEHDL